MSKLTRRVFEQVFAASREGIIIVDVRAEGAPIVYGNQAFEELTGYSLGEALGENCRFLQRNDRDQEGLNQLREALSRKEACEVMLRNYRKDGSMFWNHLRVTPVFALTNELGYYAGFLRDATEDVRLTRKPPSYFVGSESSSEDRVTGVLDRESFDRALHRDWNIVRRQGGSYSLLVFDIDFFASYNETFGHQAGDSCLRLVAHAIAGSLRRASDICVRLGDDEFAALMMEMDGDKLPEFAETIRARIAELCIHNPKSTVSKYVTVSIGAATLIPGDGVLPQQLVDTARSALVRAKEEGRDRVVTIDHSL